MTRADKVTWPQLCRAESAATAYRTARDLIRRKPIDDVVKLLDAKIAEKGAVIEKWRQQREAERIAEADREYHAQAALTDEGEDR